MTAQTQTQTRTLVPANASPSPAAWLLLARRARAVAPAAHEVADTLGWVLVTRGDTAEGLRYLDEAVAVRTASGGSGFRRAVALARLGRRTGALAQLERVLKTGKRFAERDAAEKMLNELQRASAA